MTGSGDNDRTRSFVPLAPGVRVEHFTIVEKIGEGGMGQVFLADDSRLRRQVVLKFLRADYVANHEFKARFLREAHTAAAISHPNIVTVHDICEYQDQLFIVLEYVDGKTLKDIIRERELTPAEILDFAQQIADGLTRAHDSGIIHRDLKSENIMVDRDGKIRILDFGLARAKHDDGLTKTGTTLGTVAYMSPEQIRGETVDQRSDLYSFGVVLYEMIARRLPSRGETMAATIQAIMNVEPEPLPEDKLGEVSGVGIIVRQLLAKEVSHRYQRASSVLSDLKRVAGGTALLAAASSPRKSGRLVVAVSLVAVGIVLAVFAYRSLFTVHGQRDESAVAMLAVLPFDNLGSPDDDYFASGITNEITTQLTKLGALGVISRSSAAQYHQTEKSLRQIGEELGVAYVLEGSVQWDRSDTLRRVRINTTLTDVRSSVSLWAESYHRLLDDIFAVQTDISKQVSAAMNVTLIDAEQRSLAVVPTDNIEAYDAYLQGMEAFNNRSWPEAQIMFESAIALDSSFALAWSALSRTHSLMYWWYLDRTDGRLQSARGTAEMALHLDSGLAEGYLALGRYYYRGHLDFDRALEQYHQALEIQPGNSDLRFAIGSVQRREGRWEDALEYYRSALELDPRSRSKVSNLAQTYNLMRDHTRALELADRLVSLAPDSRNAYELNIRILALGMGDLERAKGLLAKALGHVDASQLVDISTLLDLLEGNIRPALARLNEARLSSYFTEDNAYYYLQKGELYALAESVDTARTHYDSAVTILRTAVAEEPDEAQYRSMFGVALAGAGHAEEAIREGLRATELCPADKDALAGTSWRYNLAIIYAMTDRDSMAVDELKYLLSVPSEMTAKHLELHPTFERFFDRPELQDFIAGLRAHEN